jgi:trk system potassium uptake protein TrkA
LKIVLVGAGEVGYNVAKDLSSDGHDIIVVEENEERAIRVENDLDVIVVRGNGARPSVLEKAGIKTGSEDVSLLIACTNKDEVNIMACWIAKKMGVPHVIARAVGLEFTDNEAWAKDLGIDMLISPERSVAKEMEELLQFRGALHAVEVAGGKAGIYVFRIAEDSKIKNIPLLEVKKRNPNLTTLIVSVQREGKNFVPKAVDILMAGDICYSMCYRDQVHQLESLFQPSLSKKMKRVFIVGAGKIGFQTAKRLITRTPEIKICIVEEDRAKSERIAAELPEVLVICGDGADSELLLSEGVDRADGFVAATDQDETNLMLAVLGKTLGASKSIAIVKRSNYLGMTDHIPVDSIVNRNQTLAQAIIRYVRYPGSSRVLTMFEEISSEALELTLTETSASVGKTLMDLHMPAGSVIGLIERAKELIIPSGKTELRAGDKIVLFASVETIPLAIEALGE